jgi:hypothetical protein
MDLTATLATISDRLEALALDASTLPELLERLAEVKAKQAVANDAWTQAMQKAHREFSAASGPLDRERKELAAAIESAEAAESKLTDLVALLAPSVTPPAAVVEPVKDTPPLAGTAVPDDDDYDDTLTPLPGHSPELQESAT